MTTQASRGSWCRGAGFVLVLTLVGTRTADAVADEATSPGSASSGGYATVDVTPSGDNEQPYPYLTEVLPQQPSDDAALSNQAVPEAVPSSTVAESSASSAPGYSSASLDGQDTDPAAIDAFRSELAPYGRWVDDPAYGRVWVPFPEYVGSGFAPYVTNGSWALDENDDWIWVSEFPFGEVVFHYGRWVLVSGVGWSWIPGLRYAAAWVVWRVPVGEYSYVGWAPAPATYGWFGRVFTRLAYNRPLPFVFCPSRHVFRSHFGGQLVNDRAFANRLLHSSVWQGAATAPGRSYASPSLARARVPAAAVPTYRVAASPRAITPSPITAGTGSYARARATEAPFPATHLPSRSVITLGSRSIGSNSRPGNSFVEYGHGDHLPSRPVITLGSLPAYHYAASANYARAGLNTANGAMSSGRIYAATVTPYANRSTALPQYGATRLPSLAAPVVSRGAAPTTALRSNFVASPSYSVASPSQSVPSHRGFSAGGFGAGGFRGGSAGAGHSGGGGHGRRR
jgi:hypothetical protein